MLFIVRAHDEYNYRSACVPNFAISRVDIFSVAVDKPSRYQIHTLRLKWQATTCTNCCTNCQTVFSLLATTTIEECIFSHFILFAEKLK